MPIFLLLLLLWSSDAISRVTSPLPIERPAAANPAFYSLTTKDGITVRGVDEASLKRILTALANGNGVTAQEEANVLGFQLLSDYVTWWRFLRHRNEDKGQFNVLRDFIERRTYFPHRQTLLVATELQLPESASPQEVVDWFDSYPPITLAAHTRFLQALIAQGNERRVTGGSRQLWRTSYMDDVARQQFLDQFGHLITPQDTAARLERLFREGDFAQIAAILKDDQRHIVPTTWREKKLTKPKKGTLPRALLEESHALRKNPWGILFGDIVMDDQLIQETDAYERLAPRALWDHFEERIQQLLYEKKYSDAYTLASAHTQLWPGGFDEGVWMTGWIAYRYLDDKIAAYRHFSHLFERTRVSHLAARAAYWAGRSADDMNQEKIAREWFLKASLLPTTFYGQQAREVLHHHNKAIFAHDDTGQTRPLTFEEEEILTLIRLLLHGDAISSTMPFIRELVAHHDHHAHLIHRVVELLRLYGSHDLMVAMGHQFLRQGAADNPVHYPMPFDIDETPLHIALDDNEAPPPPPFVVEKALVYSIIRQESAFTEKKVLSHAGAHGAMQIMPRTGQHIAQEYGIPFDRRKMLADRDYNITLGRSYLTYLLNKYHGSYLVAVSAYNAGEHRAISWIEQFGDPRYGNVDVPFWVESITLYETRHYVQNVLAGLYVYRHLLPHSDAHRQGITLASPRNSYVMKMPKERVSERTMGAKRHRVMKTPPIPKPRPKMGIRPQSFSGKGDAL